MIEDKRNSKTTSNNKTHNIIMEGREKISVSGVIDVESFDDENIILYTEEGVLIIKGQELHINKLNIESGELNIEGLINSCTYTEGEGKQRGIGLLGKIFR